MITIYRHELKAYLKSLLIWFLCVGLMGMVCILLFSSMKESMGGMAQMMASMGAFADAFGMSQLSIATLAGFYSAEVGTIHGLGGAMFAAIISTVILSKEEDAHTSEFLLSFPVAREKVIAAKWCAAMTHVILFNVLCVCLYLTGILILGEEMPMQKFFLYHGMQILMQLETAAVCFAVSAFMKKNRLGTGLGIVLLLYALDMMARVIPDLEKCKLISPFSYANAADILSTGEVELSALVIGIAVLAAGVGTGHVVYGRRDLAV